MNREKKLETCTIMRDTPALISWSTQHNMKNVSGKYLYLIILLTILPWGSSFGNLTEETNSTVNSRVSLADFSGWMGEWGKVDHVSVISSQLTLSITTDKEVLYTIVEGPDRNTQNVYFIDCAPGGYTRHGRPGVDYVVANGYLYKVTGDNNSVTPEFVQNADRLERVGMGYWLDNTTMRLRLDQIGNPAPGYVRISFQSKGTENVPADVTTFLTLTVGFEREKAPGVCYPQEDYSLIFNPLIGGGPTARANGPNFNEGLAYAYLSWRDLEPEKGQIDFENARIYNSGEYPNVSGSVLNNTLGAYKAAGVYVNLRFIMDFPGGVSRGTSDRDRVGQQRLMAREVADIPQWLIDEMKANPINPATGKPFGRPADLATNETVRSQADSHQRDVGWWPDENWGIEGVWYNSSPAQISGGIGLAPRYEHPVLIENHKRVIEAIAAEISRPGSNWNAVANVQIGSLGHWGELHNWPVPDAGRFPSLSISEQYIRHYIDAFADIDNVQLAMRYPYPISAREFMGMFHDEAGHTSHFEWVNTINSRVINDEGPIVSAHTTYNIRTVENDLYPTPQNPTAAGMIDVSRNPAFWRYSFSGGEYGNQSSPRSSPPNSRTLSDVPDPTTGAQEIYVMKTIRALRLAHTSNLAPRGPNPGHTNAANPEQQVAYKNNDALFDNMGYRFVIEEFSVNGDLSRGNTLDVSMVVNNKGVAPFYRPWPLEISFINSKGEVAGKYIVPVKDVDIRNWMPRHNKIPNGLNRKTGNLDVVYPAFDGRNAVNFTVDVPENLPAGEHTLAITILDPFLKNHEPGINFANLNRRVDGRLLLEGIKVASFDNRESSSHSGKKN